MKLIYSITDFDIPDESTYVDDTFRRERQIELNILKYINKTQNVQLYGFIEDRPNLFDYFILRTTIENYDICQYKNLSTCLNNIVQIENVESWCSYDLREITKRPILETTIGGLLYNPELNNIFSNDKDQMFVKTKKKNFSFCAPIKEVIQDLKTYALANSFNTKIFISKPIDINIEYRCFLVNGKVSSISTYEDYKIHEIPNDVIKFADQCAKLLSKYYNKVVFDIGCSDSIGLFLVECNDIGLSGRYINNDFCQLVYDLTGITCDKTYFEFVEEYDKENPPSTKNINNKTKQLLKTFPSIFKNYK